MQFSTLRVLPLAFATVVVACGGDDSPGSATSDSGADGGATATPDASGTGVPVTPPPPGPTTACGPAGVKTGFLGSQSLTVGTTKRTYELFVPPSYDNKKSFPVVFVFHGDGGTGAGIRKSFDLETASSGGAIFVYPDGLQQTWNIDSAGGLLPDVAFIDAVAVDLGKTHCTDAKRIFSVGFSKGAYFTNMLACVAKTSFRAVVAHSGGGPFYLDGIGTTYDTKANDVVCPAAPTATMQIIGGADDLLGDAKKARDHWVRVNTCQSTTAPFDPSPCVSYAGCAAGRPETYCEIPGMGHQIWSSATKAVWGFLSTK